MQDQEAYLRQVVNVLSRDIGIRSYRQIDRLRETARYISGQFASLGLAVSRQPFHFDGNIHENVIAERKGASSPEKLLIIGAHYDTVRASPGADDNASGVAGLIGLARALAGVSLEKTVRFAAFGLEEPPVYRTKHMGSYHYARLLKEGREEVEGMICLEMIGCFCDHKGSQLYPVPFMNTIFPKTGNYIALVGNGRSRAFTRTIATSFQNGTDLPVVTLNAPPIVLGIDFSDHWSFGTFGYQALMVTDTAFFRNLNYHAPTDLPETLDYARMAKVVEGLAAAVRAWGSAF